MTVTGDPAGGAQWLPAHIRRDLDRIARDGHLGRKPTAAHPDCTCLRRQLVPCRHCGAGWDEPCTPTWWDEVDGPAPSGPLLHDARRFRGQPVRTARPRLACPINGRSAK